MPSGKSRLEELYQMLSDLEQVKVETVSPDKVNVDMRFYPRESYDFDRVALFVEAMENGANFPPILLAGDGVTLIDGAHRTFAARQRGKVLAGRRLPVSDKTDIMSLSIMTNSPAGGMPLKKGDLRRILNLIIHTLDEQHGDAREGIKKYASSMEGMSRWFHVPVTAIQRITEAVERIKENPGSAVRELPTAKSKTEKRASQPDETPWGRGDAPALPEAVVRAVLAAPASVSPIPQQSPWDYLLQTTLKTLRAYVDLVGEQVKPEEAAVAIGRAYSLLPSSDKEFVVHYRDKLVDLSSILDDILEE